MIEYGDEILKDNKTNDFLIKVKLYQILPSDKGLEYYKDMALMVLYFINEDTKNTNIMAQKLKGYKNLPSDLQGYVNELLK